ncbi:enoyl-CoA hydratase/isomerase family protein [Rhodococcus jostii]|uniref:Enoyl-CoA hydratase-related protein n=1 Tax=Rhodococcus jostii TaxID=132919 RepID=A0ABU4C6T2_RHOJO|nr:enoyl-CoA hydratase-related protein [Rhodococcus jostii]MDV6279179.1 enoyl-CoA hydratase-related protein [Rhodococcus jostii]
MTSPQTTSSPRTTPATDHASLRIEDVRNGVRVMTIDRPSRRNALDHATYVALATAIADADLDPQVRAIVLTGAGGNFTSGNDIDDFRRVPQPDPRGGTLLFGALIDARKPIIAAVEGFAVGIGATMLLHCDLAFAGAGARFRLPFTALGLSPEGASTYLLPRLAGDKRAAELLLLGEMFGADEAAEAGLINRVVESGTALAEAQDRAADLAVLPAGSIEATKALLRGHRPVRDALANEYAVFNERLVSDDAKAAFARFTAKT